jgi:hypothetical protein
MPRCFALVFAVLRVASLNTALLRLCAGRISLVSISALTQYSPANGSPVATGYGRPIASM